MPYVLAGPFVVLVGIVTVFFVLRRKSVEKRSMYSARRSQIEHKVRAAKQRTLAGHGHVEKAPEPAAAGTSPFEQAQQVQPTVTYEAPVFSPPPAAPLAPRPQRPQEAPAPMPWEQPSIPPPAPAPSSFDFPGAGPAVEPFAPAPEPMPAPSEPAWTPAPPSAEPEQAAPAASAASAAAAGSWSVVSTAKESAGAGEPEPKKKKKGKRGAAAAASEWQLASGDAPGAEEDTVEVGRSSGMLAALAYYALLVVGLVTVLIGVIVMVANSHVT